MSILTLAVAGALLIQTPPPPPPADPLQAQAQQVMELLVRMFGTLGTCERVLPPQIGEQLRAGFASQDNPEGQAAGQAMMATFEAGKASPEAATITQEQCIARINAIGAEIETLKTQIEASASAAQ